MIADIHDMRRDCITTKSHGRFHGAGPGKSAASFRKGSSNFIRRLGATVAETFEEWRPWVWPASGVTPLPRSSARGEMGERIQQLERSEAEGNIVVRFRLPGLRREKTRVEIFQGVLMLSGEYREEDESGRPRVETFFRSLTIPKGIAAEDVKTEFGDGVLQISMRLPGRECDMPIRAMII